MLSTRHWRGGQTERSRSSKNSQEKSVLKGYLKELFVTYFGKQRQMRLFADQPQ